MPKGTPQTGSGCGPYAGACAALLIVVLVIGMIGGTA